jgi:hypothetical protein
MLTKKRICPECKEPIIGRKDKKFCGDVCRTAYHNNVSHQSDSSMRAINKVLIKNRRILLEVTSKRSKGNTTDVHFLQDLGFDFSYYTHCRPYRSSQVIVFCYEVGYIRNEENKVQILRNSRT